ncbi:MAG: hypothetical protein CW338_02140 [Clostridiales bacterium]|nr:hypothetical protein [Clostridiales bacterium]
MTDNTILLFPANALCFDRGGTPLDPVSCLITEEAGGDWRLEMTLPRDDERQTHRKVRCGCILTAPVPDRHLALKHIYPPGESAALYRVRGIPAQITEEGAPRTVYRDAPLYAEKQCLTPAALLPPGTPVRLLEAPEAGDDTLHILDEAGHSGYMETAGLIPQEQAGEVTDDAFTFSAAPRQPFRAVRIVYEDGMLLHVTARHISFDAAARAMPDVTVTDMPLKNLCALLTEAAGRVTFLAGADITVSGTFRGNAMRAAAEAAEQYGLLIVRDGRRVYLLDGDSADRCFAPLWGRDIVSLRLSRDTSEMITAFCPLVDGELLEPVISEGDAVVRGVGDEAVNAEADLSGAPRLSCIVPAGSRAEAEDIIRKRLDRGWDRPETGITLQLLPGAAEGPGLYDTVQVAEPLSDTLYTGRVTRLEYDCLTGRVTDAGIGRAGCAPSAERALFAADDGIHGNVTERQT